MHAQAGRHGAYRLHTLSITLITWKKMNFFWKALAVAMIALMGTQAANAQFRFGIKAGLNLNKLHVNDWKNNFNQDNGCGFTGGVMTEFTVPLIGLCFDASLMYTHMSATTTFDNATGQEMGEASSKNFFNIPVNVKYRFGMVPVVKPFIFTGPDFAFKFGGENDVFKTKTFQCAWNIGLGFELFNHLQIAGSYGIGMNNVAKHFVSDDINLTSDFKIKNNYWTITAAYLF